MRDLFKPIANLLTVRLHPGWIRAGGRFQLALLRRFPGAGIPLHRGVVRRAGLAAELVSEPGAASP